MLKYTCKRGQERQAITAYLERRKGFVMERIHAQTTQKERRYYEGQYAMLEETLDMIQRLEVEDA